MFTCTPSVFVNEVFHLHASVKIHRMSENLHNSEFPLYQCYTQDMQIRLSVSHFLIFCS